VGGGIFDENELGRALARVICFESSEKKRTPFFSLLNPCNLPAFLLSSSKMKAKAVITLIAGWIVPGLGHAIQKKYSRSLIFFLCISSMAALGLLMGGRIYSFQTENPLTILAFFSDIGIGLLYFLSKLLAFGLGDLKTVTFEFGTAYIAGAGLLNYLVALDAFDIALGKKK
jgi:hypothetical protein